MRKGCVLLVLSTWIAVIGCSSSSTTGGSGGPGGGGGSAKSLIVGKWDMTEKEGKAQKKDGHVEFTEDGKVLMVESGGGQSMKLNGAYKFLDDDNIELEIENPFADLAKEGKNIEVKVEGLKMKLKVSVTADELTTTNEKGQVSKFKRIK